MILNPLPWKQAWHERKLSERFYQELNRLEKGQLRTVEYSSEWLAHAMAELGQLAQSMMHLEEEVPHLSHLRLAYEKALHLTALAAHLTAALEHAQQEQRIANSLAAHGPGAHAAALTGHTTGHSTQIDPRFPLAMHTGSLHPAAAPPVATAQPAAGATPGRASVATPGEAAAGVESERAAAATPPTASASPMRQTINALSRRGVSTSEIEVITGQPRQVIEAVLAQH
jgi:hypothetical protein